jgi:hypothetical protein
MIPSFLCLLYNIWQGMGMSMGMAWQVVGRRIEKTNKWMTLIDRVMGWDDMLTKGLWE